jgi:hypothetical protein
MLQSVIILKALVEVALFAFMGQGILYVLAGASRDRNVVYGILKTLTSPITKFTRLVSPRFILDQHIGLLAFFLLAVVWAGLTLAKINLVLSTA